MTGANSCGRIVPEQGLAVEERMNEKFRLVVESLQPKLEELLAMAPIQPTALPGTMPQAGVYLLSEGEKHLYVGRSGSMRAPTEPLSRHAPTSSLCIQARARGHGFHGPNISTGRLA